MKRRIKSAHVPEPPPRTWSNCVVSGNHVYIAGMYASTEPVLEGGNSMYGQSVAGGTMDDIVKVLIFVTDIERRHEVWKARNEFFPDDDFPASTLVEVRKLYSPELLIAAEAVAVLKAPIS